ncbi:MAG: hypothetical protein A2Y65_01750 [Deltaproteobacteria bacterium RBG_13_52_11]|nr:MAG: hypothetical protein A2Y65_01750 [Deltaproteobacteria bacterium RBG_13_52_11]
MRTFALLAFILICSSCMQAQPALVIHSASGDYRVNVEVVSKPADLQMGLMYRKHLAKDSGMLFIFPEEGSQSFWMKNTFIPLDMIFISAGLVIVDITTMNPCKADPCPSYTSKQPARYCLEVNAGYAGSHTIKIGDKISSDVIKIKK